MNKLHISPEKPANTKHHNNKHKGKNKQQHTPKQQYGHAYDMMMKNRKHAESFYNSFAQYVQKSHEDKTRWDAETAEMMQKKLKDINNMEQANVVGQIRKKIHEKFRWLGPKALILMINDIKAYLESQKDADKNIVPPTSELDKRSALFIIQESGVLKKIQQNTSTQPKNLETIFGMPIDASISMARIVSLIFDQLGNADQYWWANKETSMNNLINYLDIAATKQELVASVEYYDPKNTTYGAHKTMFGLHSLLPMDTVFDYFIKYKDVNAFEILNDRKLINFYGIGQSRSKVQEAAQKYKEKSAKPIVVELDGRTYALWLLDKPFDPQKSKDNTKNRIVITNNGELHVLGKDRVSPTLYALIKQKDYKKIIDMCDFTSKNDSDQVYTQRLLTWFFKGHEDKKNIQMAQHKREEKLKQAQEKFADLQEKWYTTKLDGMDFMIDIGARLTDGKRVTAAHNMWLIKIYGGNGEIVISHTKALTPKIIDILKKQDPDLLLKNIQVSDDIGKEIQELYDKIDAKNIRETEEQDKHKTAKQNLEKLFNEFPKNAFAVGQTHQFVVTRINTEWTVFMAIKPGVIEGKILAKDRIDNNTIKPGDKVLWQILSLKDNKLLDGKMRLEIDCTQVESHMDTKTRRTDKLLKKAEEASKQLEKILWENPWLESDQTIIDIKENIAKVLWWSKLSMDKRVYVDSILGKLDFYTLGKFAISAQNPTKDPFFVKGNVVNINRKNKTVDVMIDGYKTKEKYRQILELKEKNKKWENKRIAKQRESHYQVIETVSMDHFDDKQLKKLAQGQEAYIQLDYNFDTLLNDGYTCRIQWVTIGMPKEDTPIEPTEKVVRTLPPTNVQADKKGQVFHASLDTVENAKYNELTPAQREQYKADMLTKATQALAEKLNTKENHKQKKEEQTKGEVTKLEDCEISVRLFNSLKAMGIETIQQLGEYTQTDFMTKARNIGKKGLVELEAEMKKYKVKFKQ